MSKERIYTTLALVFAFFQTLLPTIHLTDIQTTIATTVLLTLASIFTLLKQRISVEINNNAKILTWVLIAIAAFGGINEILNMSSIDSVYLSPMWQERLRTIVAALIGMLNIVSKSLFPTPEGAVVETTKQDLKAENKVANENK